jgi:hypothetical protein
MRRRNLIKLLAGALPGLAFMSHSEPGVKSDNSTSNKEGTGELNSSISPNVIYASRAGINLTATLLLEAEQMIPKPFKQY